MRRFCLLIASVVILAAEGAHAHGGGLNKDGCHNNRKTGDYHCHRGPARNTPAPRYQPQRLAPQRNDRLDAPLNFSPSDNGRPSGVFRNCDAARAAGAAPVRRGEPGYGPHLDRDNDGVGCEPYRGR